MSSFRVLSSGIYCIRHVSGGRSYVGQSVNIERRIQDHRSDLNNNRHHNEYLQRAWNKYGEKDFNFFVLEECEDDQLTEREQYWIDYFGGITSSFTFNLSDAGPCGRRSQETKDKLSSLKRGSTLSDETRYKISKSSKSRTTSEATREKLRLAGKGRKQSDETRQKISANRKGKPGTNLGRKFSEEHKQKISKALKGRTASNKGIPMTEEQKLKISNTLKETWDRRKGN